MKILKYITPFILLFPVCIFCAVKTWLGDFYEYNLPPSRAVLFVSIGFTMFIVDLFAKYLIGKNKIGMVWLVELIIIGILAVMIVPKIAAVQQEQDAMLYASLQHLITAAYEGS